MKKIYLISAALLSASALWASPGLWPSGMTDGVSRQLPDMTGSIKYVPAKDAAALKAPARAAEENLTMNFAYCDEPYNAIPLHGGQIGMAIGIPASTVKDYIGNQLVALQVANPVSMTQSNPNTGNWVNTLTEATIFVSYDLTKDPVYSCKGTLGDKGFEWSTVNFEKPFDITEEKTIYVGVMYDNVSGTNYQNADAALVVDGLRAPNSYASLVWSRFSSVSNTGAPVLQENYAWKDFGNIAGCVCVRAQIAGNNLPQNRAFINDYSLPLAIAPDQQFALDFQFTNKGANRVNSVEVTMEIEGMEPQTCEVAAEEGNVAFDGKDFGVAKFVCDHEGGTIPWSAYISKINGEAANGMADQRINGYLLCMAEGFQRTVLVEELTGVKCPYCPVGYVGMESMRDKFLASGRFAPIVVHGNVNGVDPMDVCSDGKPYSQFQLNSAPSSAFHRMFNLPVHPTYANLLNAYQLFYATPAVASIAGAIENKDGKAVLNVQTYFAIDEENAPYGIAYTITEDDLGPYFQSNAYAGATSRPEYGGFENLPNPTPLKYNDVARMGSVYSPIANSIPSSVEKTVEGAEKPYSFSTTLDLSGVTNADKHYYVTAMIVNRKTGYVENCVRIPSPEALSVKGVEANPDAPVAFGMEGCINLFDTADVYAADGRLVAAKASGNVELPAGIYLVRTSKGSVKVLVR